MIYKRILLLTLLVILGFFSTKLSGLSIPLLDEDTVTKIDYSNFNPEEIRQLAKKYFSQAAAETDLNLKHLALKNATVQYTILSNIEKDNIENYIMLGRIYDLRNLDRYAKMNFYNALGINNKDADANYYFAEFYYSRKDYKHALEYYKKSLENGKKEDAQTLKKIGYIYEQYGDLQRAQIYYKKSLSIKTDEKLNNKIQEIDGLNYPSTGYDKKKLRKIKNETN